MLIGNYSVLNKGPGRFFGGSGTSVEVVVPSNWQKSGAARNAMYISERTVALKLYAIPSGNYAGKTWLLPQKSGEMSSRNEVVATLTATGLAVGGVTTTGTSTITFTVADADGQLISSGSGSASFTFTASAQLVASLEAAGSVTFAITTNTPTLGALADGSGSATMTFAGSLVPYAVGNMSGSTVDSGVLNNTSIAQAVWERAIEAGFTAEQILRIIAAHAAGAATGLEGSNPQFTGLDGTTVRIDGTYAAGTRTIDALVGT